MSVPAFRYRDFNLHRRFRLLMTSCITSRPTLSPCRDDALRRRGGRPRLGGGLNLLLLLALSLHGLTGCADFFATDTQTQPAATEEFPALVPGEAQKQALAAEKNEKYLEALAFWTQARETVEHKISALSQQTAKVSQEHCRQGVAFFEKREADKALAEFITALVYNPANRVAAEYLRNRYEVGRFLPYTVQKDDTFSSIADKVYGSSAYAFLVAEFSPAGKEKNLVEGKVIRLADKDSFHSKALSEYPKNLAEARRLFKGEKYAEAVSAARAILVNQPEDKEAVYIANMSLLKLAALQKEQQDYEGAMAALTQVDPSFRNVKKEIADVRELLQNSQVDAELKKNRDLMQKAEQFCAEGNYVAAREALSGVEPRFEGRDKLLERIESQLKVQAEDHFKKGVSFFVQEKLAAAIAEWEKTLELDPHHLHAAQSIEKARKLQQKVQEMR